ncbi:hypothetical protein DFJ73DRAFT_227869 [Zopfochytrium polystomum]|nr:hypothetical protein DFJ73DRAFT_227869 [Zopfochytrium polystomum]
MRDSEEVLQQNYLRFQKSLLQSVDRQVVQIQAKLSENEVVLKRTVDERDHIGASLYKAQLEVDRANERIERTNAVAKHFEDELHVIAGEKEASERVVKELEKKNKALLEEVEKLKERLGETVTKSSQLTDINTAYHSDIKIHRRIEEKLKKELEYVDERRREAKSDLEDQRKMCEKLQQRNAEIELILEAQKHETAMATQAVAKMHIEISHLTNEKNLMQKQWEDAMTAMGKRDETFQAVTGQKEKVLEQLLDLSNMNRALKLDKEDAEKKLANADLEKKALENQVQFLRSNLFVLENKNRDSRSAIVEAQVAESLYKQELERVSKYHKLTKDELERKSSSISELKCKLDSLKQSFDEKIRNETIVQVARKEEAVIAQALSEVSQVKKEEEGKNIDLRHENAELRLTVRKLQDNLSSH